MRVPVLFARTAMAALLCAAGSLLGCGRGDETPPAGQPRFLNQSPEAQYVGIQECRHCHLEIASTYVHTGMGRAWYRMTPEVEAEDWRENNELVIPGSELHYRMLERDGKYYQRQFMTDSRGRQIAVDERELTWAVGSNNHNRTYVTLVDGKMFQAPVCWSPSESVWHLCPGFEHDNNHFSRGVTESCVFCHNGRMVPVPGEHHAFEEPFPQGIGCERCHGPGSLHVEKWQSGTATPTGDLDPTIVNPRRLPLDRRIHVCFQCHLGDSKATHRVNRYDRSLLDFRPGQYVTEVTVPFHYVDQLEHDFGLSAQADRLILSRCYQESGGKLECLTCHNPHVTVYHPDRPVDLFRRKCLGCHAVEDCLADDAARQATEGLADDCVACHMRSGRPDDLLFADFTDHWIRRDVESDPRERRPSLDIQPVFPELFATFSEADQDFYRGRADLLLSLRTPDEARTQMWADAARSFDAAIGQGLDSQQSWFFLGKILTYQQRTGEAERAFRTALARDPDHYDAAFALGQNLGEQGRVDEATQVFQQLVDRNPGDAGALAELGRFRITTGRIGEGIELYARAIASESWNASLHLHRGMGLASLGRFDEAAVEAEVAVRLDPEDPGVWEFYARVMNAAGRAEDAAEGERVYRRLTAKGG